MPTTIEGIKFYKVSEVSKNLSVNPVTVRSWIKSGRIKAVRIGRPLLISEKEIKELINPAK